MSTFLSYASANRKVAEKLRDELGKAGIAVWSDAGISAGERWRDRIEDAIRSASAILVLIGPKNGDDPEQQFTWQVALETVWQDPGKRLIPILLRGATPPPFLHIAAPGSQPFFIRLDGPRKIKDIVPELAELIQGKQVRLEDQDQRRGSDGARSISINPLPADAGQRRKREARLAEIREYVEQLRSRPSES
jgi:TIR domain-containing protein